MNSAALLIALLVIGFLWVSALIFGIVVFNSNLKKYESGKGAPFEGGYFKILIIGLIIFLTVITVAVILFFILFIPK
jgi:hypothetical protein